MSAGTDQGDDYVIPGSKVEDAGTNPRDDARRLMSINRGQLAAPGALGIEDIAVADRAGRNLHAGFDRSGSGNAARRDACACPDAARHAGAGRDTGTRARPCHHAGASRATTKSRPR